MVIVYHNITPPEYFIGVPKTSSSCVPGAPRADGVHRALRSRTGGFRVQPPGTRVARFHRTGAPCRPDFTHLSGTPDTMMTRDFDDGLDQRDVRRPRDSEKKVEM